MTTILKIREAKELTGGGLGHPSKMPGTSYGISATRCLTGTKLAAVPGSVCEGCYALDGNYVYPSVAIAHQRRIDSIDGPQWVGAMVRLLEASGTEHHRWHDSGDLQSVEHLAKIAAVADATPDIHHWLPTREIGIVVAFVKRGGTVPANLAIRVSATMVDGPATKAWPLTSGVHHDKPASGHVCPAPTQGNKCGACRACWSRDVNHISYAKH